MGLGGEPLTKISAGNTEVEYSAPSLREKEGLRGREEGGGASAEFVLVPQARDS